MKQLNRIVAVFIVMSLLWTSGEGSQALASCQVSWSGSSHQMSHSAFQAQALEMRSLSTRGRPGFLFRIAVLTPFLALGLMAQPASPRDAPDTKELQRPSSPVQGLDTLSRTQFYALLTQWKSSPLLNDIHQRAVAIDAQLKPLFDENAELELSSYGEGAAWRVFRIRAFSGAVAQDHPKLWADIQALHKQRAQAQQFIEYKMLVLTQALWSVNLQSSDRLSDKEFKQADKEMQALYELWEKKLSEDVSYQVPDGGGWVPVETTLIPKYSYNLMAKIQTRTTFWSPEQWVWMRVDSVNGHYFFLQRTMIHGQGTSAKLLPGGAEWFDLYERHWKNTEALHDPIIHLRTPGKHSMDWKELGGVLFRAPEHKDLPWTHLGPASFCPILNPSQPVTPDIKVENPPAIQTPSIHRLSRPAEPKQNEPAPSDSEPTFRANSTLVLVPVSVMDPHGRLVYGLKKDNFHVLEDGHEQPIVSFSMDEVPISMVIVADTSGSVGPRLYDVRNAVNQLLRKSEDGDETALIQVGGAAKLSQSFTDYAAEIDAALAKSTPEGETPLLDGVKMAIDEMKKARNPRKVILVISDGRENNSAIKFPTLKHEALEAGVQIYSLGLVDPVTPQPGLLGGGQNSAKELLVNLATQLGGREYDAGTITLVPGAVSRIGMEMRRQVVIGYQPTGPADGKNRKIKVTVHADGLPSLHVTARGGYHAPKEDHATDQSTVNHSMAWVLPAALAVVGHAFLPGPWLIALELLTFALLLKDFFFAAFPKAKIGMQVASLFFVVILSSLFPQQSMAQLRPTHEDPVLDDLRGNLRHLLMQSQKTGGKSHEILLAAAKQLMQAIQQEYPQGLHYWQGPDLPGQSDVGNSARDFSNRPYVQFNPQDPSVRGAQQRKAYVDAYVKFIADYVADIQAAPPGTLVPLNSDGLRLSYFARELEGQLTKAIKRATHAGKSTQNLEVAFQANFPGKEIPRFKGSSLSKIGRMIVIPILALMSLVHSAKAQEIPPAGLTPSNSVVQLQEAMPPPNEVVLASQADFEKTVESFEKIDLKAKLSNFKTTLNEHLNALIQARNGFDRVARGRVKENAHTLLTLITYNVYHLQPSALPEDIQSDFAGLEAFTDELNRAAGRLGKTLDAKHPDPLNRAPKAVELGLRLAKVQRQWAFLVQESHMRLLKLGSGWDEVEGFHRPGPRNNGFGWQGPKQTQHAQPVEWTLWVRIVQDGHGDYHVGLTKEDGLHGRTFGHLQVDPKGVEHSYHEVKIHSRSDANPDADFPLHVPRSHLSKPLERDVARPRLGSATPLFDGLPIAFMPIPKWLMSRTFFNQHPGFLLVVMGALIISINQFSKRSLFKRVEYSLFAGSYVLQKRLFSYQAQRAPSPADWKIFRKRRNAWIIPSLAIVGASALSMWQLLPMTGAFILAGLTFLVAIAWNLVLKNDDAINRNVPSPAFSNQELMIVNEVQGIAMQILEMQWMAERNPLKSRTWDELQVRLSQLSSQVDDLSNKVMAGNSQIVSLVPADVWELLANAIQAKSYDDFMMALKRTREFVNYYVLLPYLGVWIIPQKGSFVSEMRVERPMALKELILPDRTVQVVLSDHISWTGLSATTNILMIEDQLIRRQWTQFWKNAQQTEESQSLSMDDVLYLVLADLLVEELGHLLDHVALENNHGDSRALIRQGSLFDAWWPQHIPLDLLGKVIFEVTAGLRKIALAQDNISAWLPMVIYSLHLRHRPDEGALHRPGFEYEKRDLFLTTLFLQAFGLQEETNSKPEHSIADAMAGYKARVQAHDQLTHDAVNTPLTTLRQLGDESLSSNFVLPKGPAVLPTVSSDYRDITSPSVFQELLEHLYGIYASNKPLAQSRLSGNILSVVLSVVGVGVSIWALGTMPVREPLFGHAPMALILMPPMSLPTAILLLMVALVASFFVLMGRPQFSFNWTGIDPQQKVALTTFDQALADLKNDPNNSEKRIIFLESLRRLKNSAGGPLSMRKVNHVAITELINSNMELGEWIDAQFMTTNCFNDYPEELAEINRAAVATVAALSQSKLPDPQLIHQIVTRSYPMHWLALAQYYFSDSMDRRRTQLGVDVLSRILRNMDPRYDKDARQFVEQLHQERPEIYAAIIDQMPPSVQSGSLSRFAIRLYGLKVLMKMGDVDNIDDQLHFQRDLFSRSRSEFNRRLVKSILYMALGFLPSIIAAITLVVFTWLNVSHELSSINQTLINTPYPNVHLSGFTLVGKAASGLILGGTLIFSVFWMLLVIHELGHAALHKILKNQIVRISLLLKHPHVHAMVPDTPQQVFAIMAGPAAALIAGNMGSITLGHIAHGNIIAALISVSISLSALFHLINLVPIAPFDGGLIIRYALIPMLRLRSSSHSGPKANNLNSVTWYKQMVPLLFMFFVMSLPMMAGTSSSVPYVEPQYPAWFQAFTHFWGGVPFLLSIFALIAGMGYLALDFASRHQYQGPKPTPRRLKINEMLLELFQQEHLLAPNENAMEDFSSILYLLEAENSYLQNRPTPISLASVFPTMTENLWKLLQHNLVLANHYQSSIQELFPDYDGTLFHVAKLALKIKNDLLTGKEIPDAQVRQLMRIARLEPFEGIANLFLAVPGTELFGVYFLGWMINHLKRDRNKTFLMELKAVNPYVASLIASELARRKSENLSWEERAA